MANISRAQRLKKICVRDQTGKKDVLEVTDVHEKLISLYKITPRYVGVKVRVKSPSESYGGEKWRGLIQISEY